jgi:integrase
MARRKILTDEGITKLPVKRSRYAFPDPELPMHYVRVTPSGAKSFVVVTRDRDSRQRWITIGPYPAYTIDAARKRAGEIIRAVREGKSEPDSFEAVAANFIKLHCESKGLRSIVEYKRLIGRMEHEWTGREFKSLGRADVSKMLDKVEAQSGPRQATLVLAIFSSMANWYAKRVDDYRSPLVKGMHRGAAVKRDRILDDDELRAVWKRAADNGAFGALVRLLLLTGQRREKVAAMRWEDIDGAVWTIPAEDREKGNAGQLVLPEVALAIVNAQPRYISNPFVLAGAGGSHIRSWSRRKLEFDEKLNGVKPWVLHDLRRTARSLMSRAGVRPDISERVLGHVIKGVEGVYDRHAYTEEKAHALKALAGLIETILRPGDGKVVPIRNFIPF